MKFEPAKELSDLTGKVILVTGSTSGIGFVTAQVLVRAGAKVYLGARSETKAHACIERIEREGIAPGNGQALFLRLDLADPRGSKLSAEEFISREVRLDVLINNAAIALEDFKMGEDGVQEQMMVNYLSPFIFTDTLLPLLKRTETELGADVRIINVSSDAHFFAPDNFHFKSRDDFNVDYGKGLFNNLKRYGVSKLAVTLWSRELQRHLSEQGSCIIVMALHPGSILTGKDLSNRNPHTENIYATVHKYRWPISSILIILARLTFQTPLTGAGTPAIAAGATKVRAEADKYKGAYLQPICKFGMPSKQAQDDELAKELWAATEGLRKEWDV